MRGPTLLHSLNSVGNIVLRHSQANPSPRRCVSLPPYPTPLGHTSWSAKCVSLYVNLIYLSSRYVKPLSGPIISCRQASPIHRPAPYLSASHHMRRVAGVPRNSWPKPRQCHDVNGSNWSFLYMYVVGKAVYRNEILVLSACCQGRNEREASTACLAADTKFATWLRAYICSHQEAIFKGDWVGRGAGGTLWLWNDRSGDRQSVSSAKQEEINQMKILPQLRRQEMEIRRNDWGERSNPLSLTL